MDDQKPNDNSTLANDVDEALAKLSLVQGFKEFNQFYLQHWGDRWSQLLRSLLQNPEKTNRVSLFEGQQNIYQMDQGSIWAAEALGVQSGDEVLDMCAAPGGKTLILAEMLQGNGTLIANEVSPARRERLKWVIQSYIPQHQRQTEAGEGLYIRITGKDGGLFGKTPEQFDRILIDAPCSGERYLLENLPELKAWKTSRSEFLAQRQYALLTAARIALKPGGSMVYSTCSISPLENDEVVERLLKKKKDLEVISIELPHPKAERTRYGIQVLPDVFGFGPLYYCFLLKR